jgi:hypothetical protein
MTPQEVFHAVIAIRLHFSDWEYDYFRYHGRVKNAVYDPSETNSFFYAKIAQERDPEFFVAANLVENHRRWVGDFAKDRVTYARRSGNVGKLSYLIPQELDKLAPDFDANIHCEPGRHPRLIRAYLGGMVSLETAAILTDVAECLPYWREVMAEDAVGLGVATRLWKYIPFIRYDREKISNLIASYYDRHDNRNSKQTTQETRKWLHPSQTSCATLSPSSTRSQKTPSASPEASVETSATGSR